MAAMEAAGFVLARQRFPWDAIEPQQGAMTGLSGTRSSTTRKST